MANAYLNMARSTNAYTLVERAKSMLRLGNSDVSLFYLASDDAGVERELLAILNVVQADMLDLIPQYGQVTTNLTVTAGTATLAFPVAIRDNDVFELRYADTDDEEWARREPLKFLTWHEARAMHRHLWNPGYTSDWPEYWTLDPENNSTSATIRMLPVPGRGHVLSLTYRASEAAFGSVNLSPGSTKYLMIPDRGINALAYSMAAELAKRCFGPESKQAQGLNREAVVATRELVNRLIHPPAQDASARLGMAGQTVGFGATRHEGFTRIGRGGRWTR